MVTFEATREDWQQLIRAEYLEIPGLSLTRRQAERLWGLDARTCKNLLDEMVANKFLRLTPSDMYVRADGTG